MALKIHCKKCTYFKVTSEEEGLAFCKYFNVDISIDKFMLNCPGGEFINTGKPTEDTTSSSADKVDTVMPLIEALGAEQSAVRKRLTEMEKKFDLLLNAVKRLSEEEPVLPPHTPASAEPTKPRQTEPAKPSNKKPVKKKTVKKG